MLALSALKYRNVLKPSGGPIAGLTVFPSTVCGQPAFQANAFLAPDCSPGSRRAHAIYGNADGTGTHESAQVARHLAISEALERWAFRTVYRSADAGRYGFTADPSTNGMAAFPGLFKADARRRARLEALERLTLIAWWDRRGRARDLGMIRDGIHIVRLDPVAQMGEVVVTYRQSPTGHYSYGHAAATTIAKAIDKALIELSRNETVIGYHKLQADRTLTPNFLERRCLHFAGEPGFAEFRERVCAKPQRSAARWEPIFDGEIVGPWSRYSTVWRVAHLMPTQDYLDPQANFFFW